MNIPVLYEDQYLLIIDKPAGSVVHEGAGQSRGEGNQLLTDWLEETQPELVAAFAEEPTDLYFRPGIVHRLDKETSGLLVIAKTPAVKVKMQALFKSRQVTKEYLALVLGRPEPEEGLIETFITRQSTNRRQMTVSFVGKGKAAKTEYQTDQTWLYRYKGQGLPISLLTVRLHSGRMHQIRVHLKYKGWPVIGDPTYKTKPSRTISQELGLARQFLHAKRLAFTHPITSQPIDVTSLLPSDLQAIIDKLESAI